MSGCKVPGCDRPHKSRGYCGAHAERVRRGAPLSDPIQPYRVAFEYAITPSGCWEWLGAISTQGYGRINKEYAHRVSYERARGEIPEGMQVDHLCRNRRCVNPNHLEAVTPRENFIRGEAAGAIIHRSGRCARNHEMTEENTYVRPDGKGRACRICTQEKSRRQTVKRAAERRAS